LLGSEQKEITSEPEPKQDKSPASDRICLQANELITKYKNSSDSEEELSKIAPVEHEVARLEADGEPVVSAVIAEKLGYKIQQISAMLSDRGYYQTTIMDKKSYMMIWVKKGSTETEVPDAKIATTE
jgi:hypothetical protein